MALLKAGDRLDQFLIESLVARGGMASIFRATDVRTGRPVALKVPHPEMEADVLSFDRFRREQDICREVDHPGVVRSIEPLRPTAIYLAIEWCEGTSLRRVLDSREKIGPVRAVRIAVAVCDVLDHLHGRGVIHRDLKPENIMLGAADEVTILDFGLAAKAGARRLTFGKLSRVMGTPDYIAPEQVRGKRGTARSDIYALGVILYEMLTGHTPFEGPNPFMVMNSRLRNKPAPLRCLAPDTPPSLEQVILKALDPDPGRRYASAAEFSVHLKDPERATVYEKPIQDRARRLPFWPLLAVIPPVVFVLLLYVARSQ